MTEDTLIKFLVRKDASYSEAEFKEILKHDEENRLFEEFSVILPSKAAPKTKSGNTCLNTGKAKPPKKSSCGLRL